MDMFMCAGACVGHKITNRVTKLRKTSKGGGRRWQNTRTHVTWKKVGPEVSGEKGSQSVRRKERHVGEKWKQSKWHICTKKCHNDTVILYAGIKINLKINILKQSGKIKKSHQVSWMGTEIWQNNMIGENMVSLHYRREHDISIR